MFIFFFLGNFAIPQEVAGIIMEYGEYDPSQPPTIPASSGGWQWERFKVVQAGWFSFERNGSRSGDIYQLNLFLPLQPFWVVDVEVVGH